MAKYKYVTADYVIVEHFDADVSYRDIGPVERAEMERCDDIEFRVEMENLRASH